MNVGVYDDEAFTLDCEHQRQPIKIYYSRVRSCVALRDVGDDDEVLLVVGLLILFYTAGNRIKSSNTLCTALPQHTHLHFYLCECVMCIFECRYLGFDCPRLFRVYAKKPPTIISLLPNETNSIAKEPETTVKTRTHSKQQYNFKIVKIPLKKTHTLHETQTTKVELRHDERETRRILDLVLGWPGLAQLEVGNSRDRRGAAIRRNVQYTSRTLAMMTTQRNTRKNNTEKTEQIWLPVRLVHLDT